MHELTLAFDGAIDPMWLIKAEGNNRFIFEAINQAFSKVTGWKAHQVEGQPIEKIMPPASHDLVRRKYNEAISSGKVIDYVEEALHPSGVKYGEIRVIPILGESGDTPRILGIANDITEKVYLQKKLDTERDLRNRQITAAAIRGQESERARVSRELHDNVNQVLTTVKLFIELCMDQRIDASEALPKCAAYLNTSINEIRSLSKQLSAPSLDKMDFKETLKDLIDSVQTASQIKVQLEMDLHQFSEMENELHLTLYRIVQEQFTNIMKYANAKNVRVTIKVENSALVFNITDDGVGFDATQKSKGIGITNMRSRVEILNGRFQITSRRGEGTALEVAIPVIIENNVLYAEQSLFNVQLHESAMGI